MPAEKIELEAWITDLPLLESTLADYHAAVERGEMTEDEALDNAVVLTLGMLHVRERTSSLVTETAEKSAKSKEEQQ